MDELDNPDASYFYFDNLPDGILANIVRLLSSSPRSTEWACYINLEDIIGIYGLACELRRLLRALCTSLRIESLATDVLPPSSGNGEVVCAPRMFMKPSMDRQVSRSFRSLAVIYNVYDTETVAWPRLDIILTHLTHIRELDVSFCSDREEVWIGKLGPSLESLRCSTFLSRWARHVPRLKKLDVYDLEWTVADSEAWENLGGSLESLYIRGYVRSVDVIKFVQESCRRVKSLYIQGRNEVEREALSRCIASFRDQLQRVQLCSLTEAQLLFVKNACPKSRIVLIARYDVNLVRAVQIIGEELEEIVLVFPASSDLIHVDWSVCEKVEKVVFLSRAIIHEVDHLFSSPKFTLRSLRLSVIENPEKVRAVISSIARGTGGLQEFVFTYPAAAHGVFNPLIVSNRSLSKAKIIMKSSENAEDSATDIVQTLLRAPLLRSLQIGSYNRSPGVSVKIPAITRICRKEGTRRVCISVFGECYLS